MSKVTKNPSKSTRNSSARSTGSSATARHIRPKSSNVKSTGSKQSIPEKPKKGLEWTLPAYSVCPKSKGGLNWEAIQKKMTRRNAPEGEDIKQIKVVLKELVNKKIPVHDYITLISPYTADNGTELRSVFTEDIQTFQRMVKKVYDTMTQDVSDVLMNDQVAAVQFYQERYDLMMDKMMRAINEIYSMAPEFDFEKYYQLKSDYLETIFPLPEKVEHDTDTLEMRKRQEAYHRLQWLRNEGERMSEENKRLQARLNLLKNQQEIEQIAAQEVQAVVEAQRIELEKAENKMRDQLDQLNEDVERSIIESEDQEVRSKNDTYLVDATTARAKEDTLGKKNKPSQKQREGWVNNTAREMETTFTKEAVASESTARGRPPNLRKMRKKDPDHSYHPAATAAGPSAPRDTIIERSTVTNRKRRTGPTPSQSGRRGLATRDAWR
ncbi:unnamed protein product [Psylliodes chrysocephalus]|uniref:Uncharacterized protein n=1 Tax=Psylliodes chrysocephalus TaxID=3402493 RepID=A0A9P0GCZ7_9CUCU|nr:unnamed protein product [Psylliodes chrysocephala]